MAASYTAPLVMHEMFRGASAYDRTICGTTWAALNAFDGSNGRSGCCNGGSYMSNPHASPFVATDGGGSCNKCNGLINLVKNSDVACPNLHGMVREWLNDESKPKIDADFNVHSGTWISGRLRGHATSKGYFKQESNIQGIQWRAAGGHPDTVIGLVHKQISESQKYGEIDFSFYLMSSKIYYGDKGNLAYTGIRFSINDLLQLRVNSQKKVELVKNGQVIHVLSTNAWSNGDKMYVTTAWNFNEDLFDWQWVTSEGQTVDGIWPDTDKAIFKYGHISE